MTSFRHDGLLSPSAEEKLLRICKDEVSCLHNDAPLPKDAKAFMGILAALGKTSLWEKCLEKALQQSPDKKLSFEFQAGLCPYLHSMHRPILIFKPWRKWNNLLVEDLLDPFLEMVSALSSLARTALSHGALETMWDVMRDERFHQHSDSLRDSTALHESADDLFVDIIKACQADRKVR